MLFAALQETMIARSTSERVARGAAGAPAVMVLLALAIIGSGAAAGCASSETEAGPTGTDQSSGAGGGEGGAGGVGGEGGAVESACPVVCAELDTPPCHVAVCNEALGTCFIIPGPDDEPCDDGLFCTVDEFCKAGVCGQGSDYACGMAGDDCNAVMCDEALGACALKPLEDGLPCSSNDLCGVNEACKAGQCVGKKKDCFFAPLPDVCHVSECNPATGQCEPVPGNDGVPCPNNGDACELDKTCAGGLCIGSITKDCSPLTGGCVAGVCDKADGMCKTEPVAKGSPCEEAVDECHTGLCDAAGTCLPVPTPGAACASKTDACNVGTCDAAGVCVASPTNEAGACEDGDPCSTGETCSAGACTGGVLNNYVVYYAEPFSSDMTGWTVGPEWAIGPAAASACSNKGNADPAADHTATADNGVAGVAIGGCAQKGLHGLYYLESPPINVDVPGSVWLDFQRWLNSDYKPYMRNTIEVWTGGEWKLVWQSGGPPAIQDAAWTRVTHDLTAHKSAAMKVRFGFEVQNTQGFTVAGWNIDDVVIANNICK